LSLTVATLAATATQEEEGTFVSIANFDGLAGNFCNQTQAGLVAVAPLVMDKVSSWGNYVAAANTPNDNPQPQQGEGYSSVAPLTQVYTTESGGHSITNVDHLQNDNNLFEIPWVQELLLSSMNDNAPQVSNMLTLQQISNLFPPPIMIDINKVYNDAWSLWVHPIARDESTATTTNDPQVVAGYLVSLIPWGPTLFGHESTGHKNNKVSSKESMLCVVRDAHHSQSVLYRLEGSEVVFEGVNASLEDSNVYGSNPVLSHDDTNYGHVRKRRMQSSVPLPVTMEIYPTKEYHQSFTNNTPGGYTTLVVFLLIFAALGVAIFQYYHDQQQQTKAAIRNTRQDARPDWARNSAAKDGHDRLPESNKELLAAFMKDQEHSHHESDEGMEESAMFESTLNFDFSSKDPIHPDVDALFSNLSPYNKPIADLFPDASISLADISGFTAFSSSRQPAHSFQLLETLYQTFDKVAQRKRIFKVETVSARTLLQLLQISCL